MRAIAGLEGHVSHAPAASMRAIHYRINGTSPLLLRLAGRRMEGTI